MTIWRMVVDRLKQNPAYRAVTGVHGSCSIIRRSFVVMMVSLLLGRLSSMFGPHNALHFVTALVFLAGVMGLWIGLVWFVVSDVFGRQR